MALNTYRDTGQRIVIMCRMLNGWASGKKSPILTNTSRLKPVNPFWLGMLDLDCVQPAQMGGQNLEVCLCSLFIHQYS